MFRPTLFALAALTFSLTGFAKEFVELTPAEQRALLPAGLICTSNDTNAYQFSENSLILIQLNDVTQTPEWNGDGDSQDVDVNPHTVAFNYNKGCDTNYDFTFLTHDLLALAKGTSQEIPGLLAYFNADAYAGGDGMSNEDGTRKPSVVLSCKAFTGKLPE
jgi:hypothetical protein